VQWNRNFEEASRSGLLKLSPPTQTNVSATTRCLFLTDKSSTCVLACASRLGLARESQSTLVQNAVGVFEVMEIIGKRDSKTVLD
jgi:hypothetical protein